VPVFFLLRHPTDAAVPVWRVFWDLFGASNQLLAALTLLGITIWVWQTRRAWWVWLVIGLPTLFMYVMSTWAIISVTIPKFAGTTGWKFTTDPTPWIGLVLIALALLMLIEAGLVLAQLGRPPVNTPPASNHTASSVS
jgi:carbon starvation protein